MANILDNRNVTDKFGRTRIIEPTFAFNTTTEGVELTVNGGTPNGTSTALVLNDFWRKSSVSPTTLPTAINSFTIKPNNSNDTTSFIQRGSDIFFGGADGLVRAGQGAGNIATNTVFGKNALASNTTSLETTAFGFNALNKHTTGNYSTAFGSNALANNTTGQNVAFGAYALNTNTTGSGNTAIGFTSLRYNTASNNTAVGWASLSANTTGSTNVAVGNNALLRNTTASGNVAVGYGSLQSNTTGSNNSSLGWNMILNTIGSKNIAIGTSALNTNVSGNQSIAIGISALIKSTSDSNIGIGSADGNSGAGSGITTGTENIAIGSNGTGAGSGNAPLSQMATGAGNHNIAIGSGASFIEGSRNTTVGWNNADIGLANDNVFIGSRVMTAVTANWNGALVQKVATNKNTFVGADINFKSTAKNIIGDANTALGYGASVDVTGVTNSTAIGANSVVDRSNQIVLGNNAVVELLLSGTLVVDIVGINAAADGTPIVVKTVGGRKTITI